jgi:hypothetical protein
VSVASGRNRFGLFILLRRLRYPLAVVVLVYAVAVFGFTLVPGVDPQGRPWTMSFLQAFYFISILGTTIGLGEIPHPFSDLQRLWGTFAMYATVVSWLYALGASFGVLQDPMFRRILHEGRVERAVKRLREPFHLICGYDERRQPRCARMTEDGRRRGRRDRRRAPTRSIEDLTIRCRRWQATRGAPGTLILAGLTHPKCRRRADQRRPRQHQDAHRAAAEQTCRCCARCATMPHMRAWRLRCRPSDQPRRYIRERVALSITPACT